MGEEESKAWDAYMEAVSKCDGSYASAAVADVKRAWWLMAQEQAQELARRRAKANPAPGFNYNHC